MADMTKHMIHALGASKSFGKLSLRAKVLWPMIISACDDQGRFDADEDAVKWGICQNVNEIERGDILTLLNEMADQGMLVLYGNEGYYGQVVNWWGYQPMSYARPSKYPAPNGWTDRIRYRRGEDWILKNWDTEGGFDTTDEDSEGIGDGIPKGYPNPSRQGKVNKVIKVNEGNNNDSRTFSSIWLQAHKTLNINPMIAEEMDAYMGEVTPELFEAAVLEAIRLGKRENWKYTKAIIDNCAREGRMPGDATHKQGDGGSSGPEWYKQYEHLVQDPNKPDPAGS